MAADTKAMTQKPVPTRGKKKLYHLQTILIRSYVLLLIEP